MRNKFALLSIIPLALGMIVLSQGACRNRGDSNAARTDTEAHDQGIKTSHESPEGVVRLSETHVKEFGIEYAPAAPGVLRMNLVLPGEVVLNADRIAHVGPRVSGVVREVRKNLGDSVRRGEVMAVLESRELADSNAAFLSARERVALAQSSYEREEQAWRKKISPEQDFFEAKNRLAEATIELHTAEQKLRALGFSGEDIGQLPGRKDMSAILYELKAPFEGTVIEKHLSSGEVLKDDSSAFVVADLSEVWVNLDIHQKDLPLIRVGQTASIGIGNETATVTGRITFLDPVATETNRTIHARVVVRNTDGRLRPGLFVTGQVLTQSIHVPALVPNDALILVDGKMCLFIKENDGFRPQPVITGRTDGRYTEITRGLAVGQMYATKGAFTLKSELEKPEAD